ncbi:MAG: hypothetical protein AAF658_16665, partial [Myxococcota bacterium]
MYEFLSQGGIIVFVIAGCSVVAVGVFFERLWSLQRNRIIPDTFLSRIETLIGEQRIKDALLLCQETENPMARVMAAALRNADHDRSRIKEGVEEVGKIEGSYLERYVEVVG